MNTGYSSEPPRRESAIEPTASVGSAAAAPGQCARDTKLACYAVPLTVAGMSLAIGVWVESLPAESARAWVAESGPFEMASAVFYGMAALLAGFHLLQQMTVTRLAALTMLVWACLRELDFQKRFTYRSIESIGYYTRPHAPWSEKLLVLLILSPFIVAGGYLLWQVVRHWHAALALGEKWTAYFVTGLALGATGGVLEKLMRWGAAEEVIETGLALLVLLLVVELRPRFAGRAAACPPGSHPALAVRVNDPAMRHTRHSRRDRPADREGSCKP